MKTSAAKFCLGLTLILTASAYGQLDQPAQTSQSAGPQFSAKQILPADLIRTSTYEIADNVSVVDHKFHFDVNTSYGMFSVTSIVLLEKRLSELRAIEEATRLGDHAVAAEGAWETLKQTPRGAGHLFSDPLGALRQTPRGFRKAAANFIDPVSRHAGSLARRKLAANLGVDSETRNPVLKQMLDQLVARKFVGETTTKFALSAAVPGLGTLSSMEGLRETIALTSPHELLLEMDARLTLLGAWPTVKDEFVKNTNWTLLEKLTFVQSYQQLAGIQHADVMLYLANQDTTDAAYLSTGVGCKLLDRAAVLARINVILLASSICCASGETQPVEIRLIVRSGFCWRIPSAISWTSGEVVR